MTVQELLNRVPIAEGGTEPRLVVDGLPWQKTIAAIQRFQRVRLGFKFPDGRVDPKGRTLQELNAFDKPEVVELLPPGRIFLV